MIFYARLLQDYLKTPTILVLTDRNDLDNQLFEEFAKCSNFLRQQPQQAESRAHLRELLEGRKAHGILFATAQKFEEIKDSECLSDRNDIIVIAEEAHRSQFIDQYVEGKQAVPKDIWAYYQRVCRRRPTRFYRYPYPKRPFHH